MLSASRTERTARPRAWHRRGVFEGPQAVEREVLFLGGLLSPRDVLARPRTENTL